MRIAFLTNFIPPYRKALLVELARRVEHLRVFVSTHMEANRQWARDWEDLDVVKQRTITVSRKWRHPAGFREDLALHLPVDTLARLKQFRPDVVISGEMGARTLLALAYRRLRPESRLIVWADIAQSTERGRGWMRHMLRRSMRNGVDLFLVNGASGQRYLRSLGVTDYKIAAVPSTVDIAPFAAMPLERHCSSFLYAGQLIERKGLLQFANVLGNWAASNPHREVEWLIAGDGPLRAALQGLALPANARLRLLGAIPYNEMPGIYSEASILVLPSMAESWGLVVNEAMASGLPVLGSLQSQAVEELVTDGVNGWTFRPDRTAEMADALDRCLNTSPARLHEMRAAARQTATRLSPQTVAAMIFRAIESVHDGNLECVDGNESQPTAYRG